MKSLFGTVLGVGLVAGIPLAEQAWAAPGEAEMRLHCLSLRFQPATASELGLNYTLALTTDSPATIPGNGELALLPAGAQTSHGCFYRMEGDILFESGFGMLGLNVPEAIDANTNGIADFFEVSQAVAATTTTGNFSDQYFSGKATAVWSREANSKNGTCRLTLEGYNLTFAHAFEIQEFSGPLRYTTSDTNVTGTVSLTKQGEPAKRLGGAVEFDKISVDRLSLRAGSWTNELKQTLGFDTSGALEREGNRFDDLFFFNDGDLTTSLDDYVVWLSSITDRNDANGNGIPDLSDAAIPRLPQLALTRATNQLALSISGPIGRVHRVERTPFIPSTNWIPVVSVTLTNDPQSVLLPLPTNGISFWRVTLP